MLQRGNYGRAIRLILDELRMSLRPFLSKPLYRLNRGGAIHPAADLVEQIFVGHVPSPHLSHYKISGCGVFERAVPRLNHFTEVRWGLAIEFPPLPLQDSALRRRQPL